MAGSWVLFGYLVAYGVLAIYAARLAFRLVRLGRRPPPET